MTEMGNDCREIEGERGKEKGKDKKREKGQWWREGEDGAGKAGGTVLSTPRGWTGSTLDLRGPAWAGFLMPTPGHPFAGSVQVLTSSALQARQFCWAVPLHHGSPEPSLCLSALGAAI